jgi:hypothetical protein
VKEHRSIAVRVGVAAVWLALCGSASAQAVSTSAEERLFAEALAKRDLTAVRFVLDRRPAWLNREELLAEAVRNDPVLVAMLLNSGADPLKPIPKLGGLSARDAAFAECNPRVVPILLGVLRDEAPTEWRRPVNEAASLRRTIFDIGLTSCRLRCRSIYGTEREGPGCFPDQAMDQVSGRAEYLLSRWVGKDWKPSSYDSALLAILSVLQGFAVGPSERGRAAALEAILDLQTMAEDCERGASGAGRLIPIAVHTVQNTPDQKDAGWQILYKRKLFEMDNSVEFELFPTLSSPATAKLPPGRYVVIARKGRLETAPVTQKTVPDSSVAWFIPVTRASEK